VVRLSLTDGSQVLVVVKEARDLLLQLSRMERLAD
jgi:hypothetical protein